MKKEMNIFFFHKTDETVDKCLSLSPFIMKLIVFLLVQPTIMLCAILMI